MKIITVNQKGRRAQDPPLQRWKILINSLVVRQLDPYRTCFAVKPGHVTMVYKILAF